MRISDWSSDVCSSDLVRSDGGRSSDRELRSRQRPGGAGKARGGGGQGPAQGAARRAAQPESRQLTAMNRLVVFDCDGTLVENGRASGWDRVCQDGWNSEGAVSFKKKTPQSQEA